ncbi:hypothetical protein [Pararhodobacter aggregans]|uniref:hypothetical protein n=1 Tax=Pararhodobacter aggregans TaxID=404875 RepID=UPI003A9492C8
MKRVRIVAITAVALGAAVTAGTKFQQAREAALLAAQPQAVATDTSAPAASPAAPTETFAGTTSLTQLAPSSTAVPTAEGPSLLASRMPDQSTPQPAIAAPGSAVPAPAPVLAPALAPRLSQASVLPGVDVGTPVAPAPGPATETLRQIAEAETLPQAPTATDAVEATPPLDPQLQAELAACAVWLVVTPAPGAMLETSVYAPCDRDAVVTLSHAGLSFDTHLSADGQLLAQIPALTEVAQVTIRFADGREQSDETPVADLATVERVALQWQAPAEMRLNAYEFGAGYGDAGHVYDLNPRTAGVTDQGFLTVLGDPGIIGSHLAQIYSYPRGETPRSGRVALEIEVPITDATCGRALSADTIELHGTAAAQIRQIRLDMPVCDGQGGFLVLPGVLPDMQIALNN